MSYSAVISIDVISRIFITNGQPPKDFGVGKFIPPPSFIMLPLPLRSQQIRRLFKPSIPSGSVPLSSSHQSLQFLLARGVRTSRPRTMVVI